MFKKNFSNTKNLFIFLLLIVLLIFFSYIIFKNIFISREGLGNGGETEAFAIPPYKKWTFSESDGKWYTIKKSGYKMNFVDTGMDINSKKISISFIHNCINRYGAWRNIFHLTNDDQNINMDSRIPALWIKPNNENTLWFRVSTDSSKDDGIDGGNEVMPFGIPILISLVLDENNMKIYINARLVNQRDLKNIHKRNSNTKLYIGDPWSEAGTLIKNFTIYDAALSQEDITNVYDALVPDIAKNGQAGSDGSPGEPGDPGKQGDVGRTGDTGPQGEQGEQGDKGEKGQTGPQGPKGPPS